MIPKPKGNANNGSTIGLDGLFDRMIAYEQAEARSKAPWMINQENSSLCGMAALYNVLIKKDSSLYLKIAKELYRTGEITVNNFEIKPHKEAYSMYDMDPKSTDYKTVKMPEVDWIVLATTRSREAFLFDKLVYKGVERDDMDMIKAVNWTENDAINDKKCCQFFNS